MSHIHRVIGEEIASKGVISFARFMELALYCPNFGYYERADVSPGREGDFYTSVSVGSLYGELLAFQFAEWLEAVPTAIDLRSESKPTPLPNPLPFRRGGGEDSAKAPAGFLNSNAVETAPSGGRQIMEAGAHDGRLAVDILSWLQTNRPKVFAGLEYWILEPSVRRQEIQKKTLGKLTEAVRWFESWEALPGPGIKGVIFSNELLDAMPVHRLGWDAGSKRWFEWGVALKDGEFAWTRMPENSEFKIQSSKFKVGEWLPLPPELLEVLPDGFTMEICPSAVDWWRQAAEKLKAGKLLTIDYGMAAEEFFSPERKAGTLRAYYRHHASNDLLARPGEQDITAHVNFTALQNAGEATRLMTDGLVTQAQFLTRTMGRFAGAGAENWNSSRSRQFQILTHPEHLGRAFRVLMQSR